MVGLVLVSHSAQLADGVAELAAQMAGPDVRIGAAGGMDEPGGALGTDASRVVRAIDEVWSQDGVLVLMDLGSAVLSAELAVDLLDERRRGRVLLTQAPLVEGAVAAAVAAGIGEPLQKVAAAALGGLAAKAAHLSPAAAEAGGAQPATAGGAADVDAEARRAGGDAGRRGAPPETLRVTVLNRLGLHARPAALLVRTAGGFDADVTVADATSGRGPVSARSLNAVATLGARRGDDLVVIASGPQASQALAAIGRLADGAFGEPEDHGPQGAQPLPGRRADAAATDAGGDAAPARGAPAAGTVLAGIPASPGAAIGPARRLARRAVPVPDAPAGDPHAEWAALKGALEATAADVLRTRASVAGRAGAQDAAIFDAHLLFLEDEALLAPAREGVFERGDTAARAWDTAVAAAAEAWDALEDPYQRARVTDLRNVGDQVLDHLLGTGSATSTAGPGVVIASDLSPSHVAGLDRSMITAVACALGGPTSHAAILARALGLPAVVGAGAGLLAVAEGTLLAVDGDAGTVTVEPTSDVVAATDRRRQAQTREAAAAQAAAARAAVTRDGVTVRVEANVGGADEARAAVASGADGVGLLRTEFLFLEADAAPDEDEQAAAYAAVAAALQGRPLTIRTLDAGADKPLAYLPMPPESNPYLGVRGLRLGLVHPGQLLCQLRAALRTSADYPVRVMFPMVATAEEVRRARELVDQARASLAGRGVAVPARLEVGIMLEIPSAALIAEKLAPLVDFFSVGTNDLTQYTLAAERGNAGVAALADPLHPAVLQLIDRAAQAAAAAGRSIAVCGEVAGDRMAVPLLIGLGVRELSMNPAAIPTAKQAVRATAASAARQLAREALELESAAAVRELLAAADRDEPGE